MEILVTGASGLIGSRLLPHLRAAGHRCQPVSRRPGSDGPEFDLAPPGEVVVHLAGENIAKGRWSAARRRRIRDSRVAGTANLVRSLLARKPRPHTLLCASAVGYYGDRGEEQVDETTGPGEGFLAEVCAAWEAAARPAAAAGIRVVILRLGLVLSPEGGALAKMLPAFRLGLGGRLGSGRQWMSFVHIEDLCRIIELALTEPSFAGPCNAVAPRPVRNREWTAALGRELHRPVVLPVPAFLLRLLLGEMAEELLLASTAVLPRRLEEAGFRWRFGALEAALHDCLAR